LNDSLSDAADLILLALGCWGDSVPVQGAKTTTPGLIGRQAVEQGDSSGQLALGAAYANGEGVPKDKEHGLQRNVHADALQIEGANSKRCASSDAVQRCRARRHGRAWQDTRAETKPGVDVGPYLSETEAVEIFGLGRSARPPPAGAYPAGAAIR
jgi:hypothetical protein